MNTSTHNRFRKGQIYFNSSNTRRVTILGPIMVETASGMSECSWEVELYERGSYVGLALYSTAQLDRWFPVKLGI
jgi:hypothetical protein